MGLGCGNPTAIASIQPGKIIVDLGSGGGFDCFLAARQTGTTGAVIGRFYCSLRAVKVVSPAFAQPISTYDCARSHAEGLYRFTSKSCR